MCFGGGGAAKAAANEAAAARAEARAEEEKRQARIREGQANIDTAFGQFDPAYYDKYKQTYNDFYLPQIEDQYGRARDKLVSALAGRGTLESTVGADALGQLEKTRADSTADIGNQGADASAALRKQVEDTKSNLYAVNQASADPQGISARAIGDATAIVAPRALSPLGQVFASVLQPFATFNRADATSLTPRLPWNTTPTSGRGSVLYG